MAKLLTKQKLGRYEGYYSEGKSLVTDPLSAITVKNSLSKLKGAKVSSRGMSVIGAITRDSEMVEIEEPSGHITRVPIQEIMDADRINLYWLKKGYYPVPCTYKLGCCDFRFPHQDIGVITVVNNSYAPRLAELIRRLLVRKYP